VTAFDLAALLILAVSALIGFSRGAVHEIVTLVAFTFAAVTAVFLLPFTGPLARHVVHPAWAGAAAAVVVVFVVAYVAVRVIGAAITTHLHASSFGVVNRTGGALFGAVRAGVLLAAFALVFNAVTPRDMQPSWITGGLTWPLARAGGQALASVAPHGLRMAGGLSRSMGEGVKKGFSASDDDSSAASGAGVGERSAERPVPAPPPPDESPPSATRSKSAVAKPEGKAYDAAERRRLNVLVDRAR